MPLEKTHQDAANQAETSEMPDRNPKPSYHLTTTRSEARRRKTKKTNPNTKISEGGRRRCWRCPDGEDGVGRASRPPIDCSRRITPDLARTKRNGRSNSCRPEMRGRKPSDGQGSHSITGAPLLTKKTNKPKSNIQNN